MSSFDRDIGGYVNQVVGLEPQNTAAATVVGAGYDRTDVYSVAIGGAVGATTGSPTSFTVTFNVQESSDDGSADAYSNFGTTTVVASTADSVVELDLDLTGAEQWIRVQAVVAFVGGTAPTIDLAAVTTLGPARNL